MTGDKNKKINARLQQIKERVNAATPGPWEMAPHGDETTGWHAAVITVPSGDTVLDIHPTDRENNADVTADDYMDADFIAHTRDDIPYLLALLRAERKRANKIEARTKTKIVKQLRWLAEARSDYNHGGQYGTDQIIQQETGTAELLAEIIEGADNRAGGWLPSWKWDAWTELRNDGTEKKTQ